MSTFHQQFIIGSNYDSKSSFPAMMSVERHNNYVDDVENYLTENKGYDLEDLLIKLGNTDQIKSWMMTVLTVLRERGIGPKNAANEYFSIDDGYNRHKGDGSMFDMERWQTEPPLSGLDLYDERRQKMDPQREYRRRTR